jgi:hypothetical protein
VAIGSGGKSSPDERDVEVQLQSMKLSHVRRSVAGAASQLGSAAL